MAPATLFKSFRDVWRARRRLKLTVHTARFLDSAEDCFFVTATNRSRTREMEITDIWFQCPSQHVYLLNPRRPLPKTLKPREVWETWIPIRSLPVQVRGGAHGLARARLSTGKVLKAAESKSVQAGGLVPGTPPRS